MDFLIIERKNGKFNFAFDDNISNYSFGKKEFYIPSESDLQIIKSKNTIYHVFFFETRGIGCDFTKIVLESFLSEKENLDYNTILNELVPLIKESLRARRQLVISENEETMTTEIIIMVNNESLYLIDRFFLVEELNDYMNNKDASFRTAYNLFDGSDIREKTLEMLSTRFFETRKYPIAFSSSDKDMVSCLFKNGEKEIDKEEFRWHL